MENAILELEKKYWQGMQDGNYNIVKDLTHFPCIVAGKDGASSVDEENFKKMFDSGKGKQLKVKDISGAETQTVNGQAAVLAYRIELEYTIDGKSSSSKCVCTSTWINENGKWLCAMHTETALQE